MMSECNRAAGRRARQSPPKAIPSPRCVASTIFVKTRSAACFFGARLRAQAPRLGEAWVRTGFDAFASGGRALRPPGENPLGKAALYPLEVILMQSDLTLMRDGAPQPREQPLKAFFRAGKRQESGTALQVAIDQPRPQSPARASPIRQGAGLTRRFSADLPCADAQQGLYRQAQAAPV